MNQTLTTQLNYLWKSNLTEFHFLHRHSAVNSTWLSSRFYNYYGLDTHSTKLPVQLPNSTTFNSNDLNLTTYTNKPLNSIIARPLKYLKVQFLNKTTVFLDAASSRKDFVNKNQQSWVRKLFMYLHLRRNIRRFKPRFNYYDTHRYQYRSYRSFVGTPWSFARPGYHQSFYEALRFDKSILSKPVQNYGTSTLSAGLFYLQLFTRNDLVVESCFSVRTSYAVTGS